MRALLALLLAFVPTLAYGAVVALVSRVFGDLVTTESYPVLTHGHGDSVVVRPRQVG